LNSKLDWNELHTAEAGAMLLLYCECLRLRRTSRVFRERDRDSYLVLDLGDNAIAILFGRPGEYSLAVVTNLRGGSGAMPNLDDERIWPGGGRDWRVVLSSNEKRFGGDDSLSSSEPCTIVLAAW
jgi:hypothetical protein